MTKTSPLKETVLVAICTRNRADLLTHTLDSLCQDSSVVGCQILVVDNASTDGTRSLVERTAQQFRHAELTYFYEPRVGLSHARNAALRHCQAEIIAFTDDDVLVADKWLENLIAPLVSDRRVAAVGGRVLPAWIQDPGTDIDPFVLAALGILDLGECTSTVGKGRLPIGASIAFRAKALEALAFDPDLGNRGRCAVGHEEILILQLLLKAGHLVIYAGSAVAYQQLCASRLEPQYLCRLFIQRGIGLARVAERIGSRPDHQDSELRRCLRVLKLTRSVLARKWNAVVGEDQLRAYEELGYHVERALRALPRVSEAVGLALARRQFWQ